MGGDRITSTGLVDVAADYSLFFLVKDGSTLQDTHFYGYLMHKLKGGGMSPLFEFHWHPSHKGFHCKTPCRTTSDYTDRTLPNAPELKMKTKILDPRKSQDRQGLVAVVCEACGVTLRSTDDFGQMDIWNQPST